MSASIWIGWILVAVAVLDAAVGVWIIAPRLADQARPRIRAALLASSVGVLLLGLAFLFGLISISPA